MGCKKLNNGKWKLGDKVFSQEDFETKLSQIGENDPEQPVVLIWSNTATVQDLVDLVSSFEEKWSRG